MNSLKENSDSFNIEKSYEIKLKNYKNNILELNTGFEMVNLYRIKCPKGHIIEKYVPSFLKLPTCRLCDTIESKYLFKALNERHVEYKVEQIKSDISSNHYNGLRIIQQIEVHIYDENNIVCGNIYFITIDNKESINVSKTQNSKSFNYKKIDDIEYCNTFLDEFLNK